MPYYLVSKISKRTPGGDSFLLAGPSGSQPIKEPINATWEDYEVVDFVAALKAHSPTEAVEKVAREFGRPGKFLVTEAEAHSSEIRIDTVE